MDSILHSDRAQTAELSPAEMQRYARHLAIPDVGVEGQRRLKSSRVLCIGAGGLGSPASLYLAAAGVGTLGIVDFDKVDASNLQRQILHGTDDVGRPKIDSAIESLGRINPEVKIERYETAFTADNAIEIADSYDLILDGTDNFATRYLSNDVAALLKKPNVYGSIFRFEGQCSVFAPHLGGPCYRCLFPEPPAPGMVPNCAEGGVLGVLPGIIGSLQCLEAIKLLLGIGDPLLGRLVHFDALRFRFREFKLRRDPECPLCGDQPTITELIDYEEFCGLKPSADDSNAEPDIPTMSVEELQNRLEKSSEIAFTLLDVREPSELEICKLGNSVNIPLGELADRIGELDLAAEIVVHCKLGGRSAKAVEILLANDFKNVTNVAGGIDAWGERIDPEILRY
jgi:molybdopterin/thiamine biosynthesis adenylyltransferase/rhodanese-related sulfurtransferase